MPTQQELDRAVRIIEHSAFTRPPDYDGKDFEMPDPLDDAIETINQSGEVDIVYLDNDQTALSRAICLLGIGIFLGLILAGVIYSLTV